MVHGFPFLCISACIAEQMAFLVFEVFFPYPCLKAERFPWMTVQFAVLIHVREQKIN